MYEVYIYEKRNKEYILNPNGDPFIATSDSGLLDLISTFFMDANQEISLKTPKYMGHDINISIYPQFKSGGLVMNRKTFQVRRVNRVGIHHLYLHNTDDKRKADMQKNGYILSSDIEVQKDDWMPIDDSGPFNIYYPNSSIGKDKDFDKMEYDGLMTL